MKYLIFLVILLSVSSWGDTNKSQLSQKLLKVMNMDSQLETMAINMREMQARQLSQHIKTEAHKAIIEKHLNDKFDLLFSTFKAPEVKQMYAQVYENNFSESELTEIIKFYESGAGKIFLKKFPLVMKDITTIAEQQLESVQPQLIKMNKQLGLDLEKAK